MSKTLGPLWILSALFLLTAKSVVAAQASGFAVKETVRGFADRERSNWLGTGPRTLQAVIWAPVPTGSTAQNKFPLVLLSHGAGGDMRQLQWLGRPRARLSWNKPFTRASPRLPNFLSSS